MKGQPHPGTAITLSFIRADKKAGNCHLVTTGENVKTWMHKTIILYQRFSNRPRISVYQYLLRDALTTALRLLWVQ